MCVCVTFHSLEDPFRRDGGVFEFRNATIRC